MECPYCKKEMREGYIQGARGVFFSERERILFFRAHRREKDVVIAGGFWECSAPAHYCDGCGCLITFSKEREQS